MLFGLVMQKNSNRIPIKHNIFTYTLQKEEIILTYNNSSTCAYIPNLLVDVNFVKIKHKKVTR